MLRSYVKSILYRCQLWELQIHLSEVLVTNLCLIVLHVFLSFLMHMNILRMELDQNIAQMKIFVQIMRKMTLVKMTNCTMKLSKLLHKQSPNWAVDTGPNLGSGYCIKHSVVLRFHDIFLSLTFYVKSIYAVTKVQNLPL